MRAKHYELININWRSIEKHNSPQNQEDVSYSPILTIKGVITDNEVQRII